MEDRGLLVVSVGTSDLEAWQTTICPVEQKIQAAFPGWQAQAVYTNPRVRRSWAERGQQVPSLPQALEQMAVQGVKRLVVQPTHLICGLEYHQVQQQVTAQAGRFERVSLGAPLLYEPEDYRQVAQALAQGLPVEQGEALVLVGHGTDHPMGAAYPALAYVCREMGYSHLFVGTVKGRPGVLDVLQQLQRAGYHQVLLAPLMLTAGAHAQRDMMGSQNSWKTRLQQAGLQVRCTLQGLGSLEEVRQLYLDHARRAAEHSMES